MAHLFFSYCSLFPPSISRGLPSVIQPTAPVMPRQCCFRSLPCSKHHLSKCPERDHGHHTVSLSITDSTSTPTLVSIFFVSSTYTTPPNTTSSAELFPGPADLPAAATIPKSKSAVISNEFPTSHPNASPAPVPLSDPNTPASSSTASLCPLSPATLQIHLLWLFVPASLLSSSELLLGSGSESPAFCAAPSCPLRHYHSQ